MDVLAGDARTTLEGFVTSGRLPDTVNSDLGWRLAVAFVLGSDAFVVAAHAAVDAAAEAGHFSTVAKAEVAAQLDAFAHERRMLDIATEDAEVTALEAEARARRADLDRRSAEAVGG